MKIDFSKMHGLGNDFMVIDAIRQTIDLTPGQIRFLADRHTGVGFDQCLLVETSTNPDAAFRYRIFNADGGEVQQCGNGARCFARFVIEKQLTQSRHIPVETAAGLIWLKVEDDGQVTVDMGEPDFSPKSLPFLVESQQQSYTLTVDGQQYRFAAVSMGNPHVVLQVDNLPDLDVATIGKAIGGDRHFPEGVNVGFMQVQNRQAIALRVFERGAGETQACGTGACAAVAAGIRQGILDARVRVHLRGGELVIDWKGDGQPLHMTGPATNVFEGSIVL